MVNKKIVSVLLIVLLMGTPLASFPHSAGASAESELLPNSGFEEVQDGKPMQWEPSSAIVEYESSTDEVYEGDFSVKIIDPNDQVNPSLRSARIPVVPGTIYEASVFSFNETGTSHMYLRFWDSAGNRIGSSTIRTNRTVGEWAKLEGAAVAPEHAVYATILLNLDKANIGVAYFDNASLKAVPPEAELLPNSNFEKVTEGKPKEWEPFGSNVDYESSQEQVYEGEYSVKITDPTADVNPGLRSKRVSVAVGENYKASVYAYNVSGSSTLYLEFWDRNGTRIETTTANNAVINEWREMEVVAGAPEGAAYATVLLNLSKANIGVTYFDKASFKIAPPEQIREFPLLEEGHPRLFFTSADIPDVREKARDTSESAFGMTGQSLWTSVAAEAQSYLTEEDLTITYYGNKKVTYPLPPKQPDPIEDPPGWEGGPYPYWTTLSTRLQTRMETLSLAYVVTGETAFAERAKAYALALADWDTWGDPSTGDIDQSRLSTTHFTRAVTITYDMLYDFLTEAERSRIETALETKGLSLLYKDAKDKIDHNIQMHRAAALGSGGAALLGKNPNANKYLTRATEYYKWYLDERMNSGQQEGHHYTNYALESFMQAIDHIARTTGEQDLIEHPFFNDFLVRWAIYSLAPGGGGLANFSDGHAQSYYFVTMSVINSWLNDGHAGWYLAEAKPSSEPLNQFIHFNPDGKITPPNDLSTSTLLDDIGWATLRSGWQEDDMLLAFVANNSHLGHNHYDQNSFQIATNGSWIATDPGYADFSPGPTNDFTMKMGHSTIQVDGQGQSRKGGGHLGKGLLAPNYDYVKGSASDAYIDPKLDKFDRHIVFVKPHYYVMLDDLKADVPRTFDWILYSGNSAHFEIDGDKPAPGQVENGETLYVQNRYAQLAAKFLSPEALSMTIDTYAGAEEYGYYARVGSGGKKTEHQFLTVLQADPIAHVGYRYNALELLPPAASSGKGHKLVSAAGTTLLFYRGEEVGDFMTLTFDVEEAGTYDVSTLFIQSPAYGQVQTYIDGEPVGGVYDGYNNSVQAAEPFNYGEMTLSAGRHTIRYEVVGQHSESSNYFIGVDAIQLIPADAEDPGEREKTTIDAELMQGHGAMGAMIHRGDGDTITDLVVFKTDGADYMLNGVASDADQVVVSHNADGDPVQYNMTNGTSLNYDGIALLEGQDTFNAALAYDSEMWELEGTIEVDRSGAIRVRSKVPQRVVVDGEELTDGEYTFDKGSGILTVNLEAGSHHLKVESEDVDREVTVDAMQQLIDRFVDEGAFENEQAVRTLQIHLTAVGRYEAREAAEKVVKHMKGFNMLLDHQRANGWISEAAYQALQSDANAIIQQWR